MGRRLPYLAAAAAVVVLAAGCGGGGSSSSDTTSTADWANGVCTAIDSWTTSVQAAANSVKGGNLSKNSFNAAVDKVETANQTLVSDLKKLGKPDTAAGTQAKASLDQLSTEIDNGAKEIRSTLKSASSTSALIQAIPAVTTAFTTMASEMQSTYHELQQIDAKGELQKAFNQSKACKNLKPLTK